READLPPQRPRRTPHRCERHGREGNPGVSDVVEATRRWISSVVVGLNLCPFARRVFDAGLIRFVVSDATDDANLLEDLERELNALAAVPRSAIETTLLIHPGVLTDFLNYNDFLATADEQLRRLGLEGVIQ